MAQHEMTRHETGECAFYILFEMQFQNDTELDEIISAYSTKRVINRIPKINLSILRLALYEIRYDAQMPMNAAIAEAISLAKAYGYQEDISFINGVLGNYARDHAKDTGTEQHA